MYWLRYFVLCWIAIASVVSARINNDPYKILGVSKSASQDEIRSKYKKACLKYHPDKNGGKSPKEKARCEEIFKRIQSANDLIGDKDSRRSFDIRSSFPTGGLGSGTSQGQHFPRHQFNDESVDAFYRAFAAANAGARSTDFFGRARTTRFSFTPDNLFPSNIGKAPMYWTGGPLKSSYVQKIKVPLQDLYSGRSSMEFNIEDSIWKRYSATFRGGLGWLLLYQSLIFSAPLLRINRYVALAVSAFVFHKHVPKPTTVQYTADILSGYKEGTKIIFNDAEVGVDVIFLIEEGDHDRFKRVGNDLHTTVDLLASQAKSGCSFEVAPLNQTEKPTLIKLRPQQIKQSGDILHVKSAGWPNRKTGKRGDLVITFKLVRSLSRKGKKQKTNKISTDV